jgi:cyclophilin family peptidyl-prolyl cis-trans isomerase
MRLYLLLLLPTISALGTFKQAYKPKSGETDLKIVVEGRGDVFIKLFPTEAPKTVTQIVKLVKSGFYNDLRFHRVDKVPKPYLIQVGDPQSKTMSLDDPAMGSKGSGEKIPYENTGRQNVVGAVGLAHSVQDQDSGDSQFYIVLGPAKFLDGHYTVFGEVVSGMSVVNQIELGDRIKSASIITG